MKQSMIKVGHCILTQCIHIHDKKQAGPSDIKRKA
jgi:hypothetical protein